MKKKIVAMILTAAMTASLLAVEVQKSLPQMRPLRAMRHRRRMRQTPLRLPKRVKILTRRASRL